jgi:hypothetical protein
MLHHYMAQMTHAAKGYLDTESIMFAKLVKAMADLANFCVGDHDEVEESIWTAIHCNKMLPWKPIQMKIFSWVW